MVGVLGVVRVCGEEGCFFVVVIVVFGFVVGFVSDVGDVGFVL